MVNNNHIIDQNKRARTGNRDKSFAQEYHETPKKLHVLRSRL